MGRALRGALIAAFVAAVVASTPLAASARTVPRLYVTCSGSGRPAGVVSGSLDLARRTAETVYARPARLEIELSSHGKPVTGALICLYRNGVLFRKLRTNGNGYRATNVNAFGHTVWLVRFVGTKRLQPVHVGAYTSMEFLRVPLTGSDATHASGLVQAGLWAGPHLVWASVPATGTVLLTSQYLLGSRSAALTLSPEVCPDPSVSTSPGVGCAWMHTAALAGPGSVELETSPSCEASGCTLFIW